MSDYGIDVPRWVDPDIDCTTIAAIVQGGCASGAYMPAVTYNEALQTMTAHGDDVLQFIEDTLGTLPSVEGKAWAQVACAYVSCAVELWAAGIDAELSRAVEDEDEGGEA